MGVVLIAESWSWNLFTGVYEPPAALSLNQANVTKSPAGYCCHGRTLRPDRSAREAARLKDELNVGFLPVCDGHRLVGVLTDRDIAVRSLVAGLDPDDTQIDDVMTDDVRWCCEDDDGAELEHLMCQVQIPRVPVVNQSRQRVGIVALGDLAADRVKGAGEILHRVSEPSEPDRPRRHQ